MCINFLFKCSNFGLLVQGSIEKSALPPEGSFMPYDCPACGTIHLVDPRRSEGEQISSQPESN
jgi:hypothetical protein